MKRTAIILSILLVMGSMTLHAQTRQVSGTVISTEDGQPIPGVSIYAKGTTVGTTSNVDGEYTLDVPPDATTIVFSFIGMVTLELPITSDVIDASLESDVLGLEEVMVVAYGVVRKESLTGSASVIDSKKLEARSLSSLGQILTGSTTGVQTTAGSGQPGSSPSIRIRGVGTLNTSADPLIVMDGSQYSGSLSSINPTDIESITILKDASSTALYGSRAANGVIIITSKSGKKGGESMNISFKAQGGLITQALPYTPSVDAFDYYELQAEAFGQSRFHSGNSPTIADGRSYAYTNIYSQLRYNPFVGTPNDQIVGTDGLINPSATIGFPDLDWYEPAKQTGYRQNYDLNISGGSNNLSYYYSLGYLDERGYTIKSDFNRVNTRLNVDYSVKKWLQIGANMSASMVKSDIGTSNSATYANPFRNARMTAPIYPVYLVDQATGDYILDGAGEKQYDDGGLHSRPINQGRHTIAELNWNSDDFKRNNLSNRVFATFTILDGLTATFNASVDVQNYQYKGYENPKIGDGAPTARMDESRYTRTSTNFNQLINYEKTFNEVHSFSALIGHEAYERVYTSQRGFKNQFIVTGIYELNNFVNTSTNTSYTTTKAVEGYFGRLKYNYDNKYYIEGSYRRDGSSSFHKDVRWGNFYSVGGSWRISQEEFLSSLAWVDNLKLRASYGQVGNDNISGYQALYGTRPNASHPGIRWESVGNEALTWEVNTTFDVALDFSLFNRLNGSVEYYHRKSDDLLYSMPLPISMGLLSQPRNIASMFNSGLEINLSGDIVRTNDFRWNLNLMGSTLTNEITSIPEPFVNGSKKWSEGHSIYDFWLRKFYDIDPDDGATRFHVWDDILDDDTGEVIGTELAYDEVTGEPVLTKDRNDANYGYVGASAFPDLQGSILNTFTYKGFTLSALLTYSLGGQMLDGIYQGMLGAVPGESFHPDVMNSWRNPGDISDFPRLQYSNPNLYATSDYFLISSDYLNIRNITISYDVPQQLLNSWGVNGLSVFVTGENLYMFTARESLNPTYNFSGGSSVYAYQPSKSIILGLNLTF